LRAKHLLWALPAPGTPPSNFRSDSSAAAFDFPQTNLERSFEMIVYML